MPSCYYNRIVRKRRILVTGGAGYIGAHTVRMLRRRGYEVTVVDDLSRGYRHNVEAGPFHQLRVQQTDEMAEVLAGHDAVVHFAAYIAVGESMCVPEMYFENNVGGSLSLVTAMVRAGVKRLVFSSTAAVYGIPHASPILESFPIAPVNPYGESKVMVETMLRWFDSIHGLRSVCLRYFNACGREAPGVLVDGRGVWHTARVADTGEFSDCAGESVWRIEGDGGDHAAVVRFHPRAAQRGLH